MTPNTMSLKRACGLVVAAMAVPSMGNPLVHDVQVPSLVAREATADGPLVDGPCVTNSTIQRVTWFGERPSYRRDGQKIAFMSKSYGDVFELDLRTQHIKLLTGWPHSGFLRAQYLINNDLFLIGARNFTDMKTTRAHDMEMWILKPGAKEVIPLNHKIYEGVAISIQSNKISWANNHDQYPDQFNENESAVYVADIDYSSGKPCLANKREVFRATAPNCTPEPQDFRNNDTEIVYTCYATDPTHPNAFYGRVEGIKIDTGEKVVYRDVPGQYNEVEGMYPNEKYALVESAWSIKNNATPSVQGIDIYQLRLEPNSTDWKRLTYFSETKPWKAGNPVVSPDGRSMCVQSSRNDQEAGVGYGLYIQDLFIDK
ncbi:hypothetical protein VTK73DRAFT_2414 [Phialemonium thermophilum]|uniref:Uncharacterized protein n=1 Tax=Phialemonium thermophilum TaxID=223376 RepID=A0ABR3X569_9PEZI